jgi:hypothetical protein
MWDFLYKGGASQIHPHLQCSINEKKYYSNFELLRHAAEIYYRETQENYFNDFVQIHHHLGLSYLHKDTILIVSLVSFKFVFI